MVDIAQAWSVAQAALEKPGNPVLTATSWTIACSYLSPSRRTNETGPLELERAATDALQQIERAGLQDNLLTWYLAQVRLCFTQLQHTIIAFLDEYDNAAARDDEAGQAADVVARLLHQIGLWTRTWQRPIDAFWPTAAPLASYRQCCLTSLYSVLPPRFSHAFTTYLRSLLHSPSSPSSPSSSLSPHSLAMPTLITLLDRYDPLLFGLIYDEIEKKVDRDCRGDFAAPKLAALNDWLAGGVLGWVSTIYARSVEGGQEEAKKMLKPTFSRFEYHVNKVLCALRTTELFDMIVDFPSSLPALEDLKSCLYKTDQRTLLVSRLRDSMDRRLLHPGADTKDIITQYISTIKCLRVLDPQGVLLSRVADPIRQYLRSREDTIRCIVTSLIEEGNELVAELVATDARPLQDARDEAENFNDPKWTPDPIDAPLDFRKSKGSDIIQLLVSIYDTKDVFVKELQVLLAQRLLLIKDYALEREIKNVEILKIRFGEASLQGCEVMIKDLQDSKRIDQHVHDEAPDIPIHLTIVSRLFWPSLPNPALKLPGQLGKAQASYNHQFALLKPDKKLRWLPQHGSVNLTLSLSDRSLTFDCSPLQASVIELFGTKDTWSAEAAVSHVLEVEAEVVQSVDSQQVEQMRVYTKFLQGILTNLGPQPATRMHTTLSTVIPDYKGHTIEELQSLLEIMQAEGLVEKSGNDWRIVK
ncbi:hypothetical protein RQP46_000546 [Phenoliferia psychrophenolica]